MGRSGIILAIVLIAAATSAAGCLFPANNRKLENVIGIDLGTTAYRVSAYMNGHIEIIPSHEGNRSTPSMVAFTDSERFIIGEAAKNQAVVNPQRTIFDVNRFLGRRFEDNDVQRDMKLVPYKVVNKDGKPHIEIQIKDGETKVFSPEEISAMFLTKIKETSEAFLGKKVTDAVVTLPAYCSYAQAQAARDAFLIAGYEGVTTMLEPVAAAHAYYLHNNPGVDNILVFHIGDTTFQVTIMERSSDFYDTFATNGDTRFGGKDFNQRIMEYLINLIKNKYGKDISNDNKALLKLRAEAERAKRVLSNEHEVRVEIKSLFDGVNLSEPLTRARFEELNDDLFAKTMGHVKKAMEDSGLEKHQIDYIIIVGGNANIPKVQQLLRDYFDGRLEPMKSVVKIIQVNGLIIFGLVQAEG